MNKKKTSSKVYSFAKSALTAVVLPVFLIYIMIDKPDYRIMNGLSKVVLPVAEWIGEVITWPISVISNTTSNIRELSILRIENEELKAKLHAAMRKNNECNIAIAENQRLAKKLAIVRETPQKSIVANITYKNEVFGHNTFFINKGLKSGIEKDMAVVSFEGTLIGLVSDVGVNFAKIRGLTDRKSNIPVRISGSEVYGFLKGNGSETPTMGFFSDPEFQPTTGLKLITSGIRGMLPDGINVGEMTGYENARVILPSRISSVMVLQFDRKDKYK